MGHLKGQSPQPCDLLHASGAWQRGLPADLSKGAKCIPKSIDPTSDRSVYRQIADQLRTAMREGRYVEGDLLPSETALARPMGCPV
jgi:hypothetical protein